MSVEMNQRFNLKSVINASGKMTVLGVSKVSDSVVLAQKVGGQSFFEIADLFLKTGEYLANLLEAEDAHIVSCASAGIVQSVAGVIGRGSKQHLLNPYDFSLDLRREILIPKGHNIDYGTPIEIMIQQGGGTVVEVGYSNVCTPLHLESKISSQTAGIIYVVSHHAVQKSMLSLEDAIGIAKSYEIPLIVDAAAEEDVFKYTRLGADVVIYSGAKAFNGPSSGLVVGRYPYIEWVRWQSYGLGRSMKIGKDNILGLVTAVEQYVKNPGENGESMKVRLKPFVDSLNLIENVFAEISQDGSGRDIFRAKVKISGKLSAIEVVELLQNNNPSIYTRNYLANEGIIEFDIRSVNESEMNQIIEAMNRILY